MISWANLRGASNRQVAQIVALPGVESMRSLPLPPRTHRKAGTPDYLWLRFLFRRHIQHILHWTTRREESDPHGFGSEVNTLIRERFFPDPTIVIHGSIEIVGEDAPRPVSSAASEPNTSGSRDGFCQRRDVHGPRSAASHGPSGGAQPSFHNRGGSPTREPRDSSYATTEPRHLELHLGAYNSSAWERVGIFCAPLGIHAAVVPDVSRSLQSDCQSAVVEAGSLGETQPGMKTRKRCGADFGRSRTKLLRE